MGVYYSFAQKRYRCNAAYGFENLTGIFYSLLNVCIYITIFKVFLGDQSMDGVTVPMLSTNYMLTCLIGATWNQDELFLSRKVQDGSITTEFLRPVNLKIRLLAESIGDVTYSLVFQCLPAFLFSSLMFTFQMPKNMISLLLFLISLVLGFLIYWSISFMVQVSAFFIINVWSVSTIKEVLIHILAGVYLPMWCFPDQLRMVISYTPFEGIFFLPIEIYFGRAEGTQILFSLGKQLIWVVVLWWIGDWMLARGKKKMMVQGG